MDEEDFVYTFDPNGKEGLQSYDKEYKVLTLASYVLGSLSAILGGVTFFLKDCPEVNL